MHGSDLNHNKESSVAEKYSFVSLYLFILIFFIILTRLSSNKDDSNISRFIDRIKAENKVTTTDSYQDASSVYYSDTMKALLPAEASMLSNSEQIIYSHNLSWGAVFCEDRVAASFAEEVEKIKKIPISNISYVIFYILGKNEDDLYLNTALLTKYLADLKNLDIRLEVLPDRPEQVVKIKVFKK